MTTFLPVFDFDKTGISDNTHLGEMHRSVARCIPQSSFRIS